MSVANPSNPALQDRPSTLSNRQPRSEIFYIILFITALLGLKLGLGLFLWRTGFLEYDADGFTRSVFAWQLYTGEKRLEIDAWLPLQFWLNGWLFNFWPDLLRVPRVVNTLCSLLTTVNLFFIGRQLFGKPAGYLTALLTAFFPWEIWFSLSGMSESLTHVFLSAGLLFLCRWLNDSRRSPGWLLAASLGLLGATMVRYEAWFYSALYALVIIFMLWRSRATFSRRRTPLTVLALAPAFLFVAAWMLASWADPNLRSPLGFARLTSEINARIYGAENSQATFLYRLFFYPQTFLRLLPPLTLLAVAGSIWVWWRPVGGARAYLALVWGEFGLFILTTLPYNNIAPGSARYPVSNLLLLLPVVGYLLAYGLGHSSKLLRWGAAALVLGLLGLLLYTTLGRSRDFPDGATRQVASWLSERWREGYLRPAEKVLVHLPAADGPQAAQFTRAYYALKVLTNHPDAITVEADYATFSRAVLAEDGQSPHVWVHLDAAGGSLDSFGEKYREVMRFGDYVVGRYPAFRAASGQPGQGQVGQTFSFRADEYGPNETTAIWVTRPDGQVISLGNKNADRQGNLQIDYRVTESVTGQWSITIVGMETGRRAVAMFEVKN